MPSLLGVEREYTRLSCVFPTSQNKHRRCVSWDKSVACGAFLNLWQTLISSKYETSTHWGRYKMATISQTENVWSSIKFSLRFVPSGPVNNIPALVKIMAWRRPGGNHYLNQWWLYYRRIYAYIYFVLFPPKVPMDNFGIEGIVTGLESVRANPLPEPTRTCPFSLHVFHALISLSNR